MPAPKLLEKKAIQASLATERKQEIDKGIKLAKSIDALRETKVQEEQSLEQFRLTATKSVQIEMEALTRSRDSIRTELVALRIEREKLQEPLTAQSEVLDKREEAIRGREQEAWEALERIKEKEKEMAEEAKSLSQEKNLLNTLKTSIKKLEQQAISTLSGVEVKSATLVKEAQEKLSGAEEREQEVSQREVNADMLERRLNDTDCSQKEKEEDLQVREIQLQEGWKNLQETAERVRQGKL